jgi:hypothetical protein
MDIFYEVCNNGGMKVFWGNVLFGCVIALEFE